MVKRAHDTGSAVLNIGYVVLGMWYRECGTGNVVQGMWYWECGTGNVVLGMWY